jgi:hypothetical protein
MFDASLINAKRVRSNNDPLVTQLDYDARSVGI